MIVTYDRVLDGSDDTPFDCGAVATALVNAAWSRGLGAVINSQGIMQSPVVRDHAGIADDQFIMKSIALGWPDETLPANAVVSERKSVEEATVFVGFEKQVCARARGAIRYRVRRNFFTYDRKLHRDSFNALTRSCSARTTARRRGRYSQWFCAVQHCHRNPIHDPSPLYIPSGNGGTRLPISSSARAAHGRTWRYAGSCGR